jgi:hypothetical protein
MLPHSPSPLSSPSSPSSPISPISPIFPSLPPRSPSFSPPASASCSSSLSLPDFFLYASSLLREFRLEELRKNIEILEQKERYTRDEMKIEREIWETMQLLYAKHETFERCRIALSLAEPLLSPQISLFSPYRSARYTLSIPPKCVNCIGPPQARESKRRQHAIEMRKRFPCTHPGCEKTLSTKYALQRHEGNVHAGFRTYVCDWVYEDGVACGERFAQPSTLKRHVQCHTGEKPFVCNICSKAFADKINLTRHRECHETAPF